MFIDESVTVCSKYADFLRVTLPHNLNQIRKMVVVTSDEAFDDPTRDLCREYGVKCVSTSLLYAGGAKFAKGRAINKGLDQCHKRSWVATIDADTLLPPQTGRVLSTLNLDTSCLYGIDRVLVPNAPAWKRFLDRRIPQYRWSSIVETPAEFPLMARYVHETEGYCPIGYFTLFHGDSRRTTRDLRYPEDGNEATHTDVQFSLHWDRHKRHLIPEVFCYHLDACPTPIGVNWAGRKSPEFDLDAATPPSGKGLLSYYDKKFSGDANPNETKKSYTP